MSKFCVQKNSLSLMNRSNIQKNELTVRREKLLRLRELGYAFPNNFRRSIISNELHEKYGNVSNKELRLLNIDVRVSGRMMSRRVMGKISFVTLQDIGGNIQLYVFKNFLSEGLYDDHFKMWDIGDILGASGSLFKTRTGELSVRCRDVCLLTKSLRSLPGKFHKLVDRETRYRKRYLDLIVNCNVRDVFKMRAFLILEIRRFMLEHDFIEVETPILQSIAGGAFARPFVTKHNALNVDMYLRISPELYLKRLIVGGFERIFEISRNFRNEGISTVHNPEFTMMEVYMAYTDYRDMMIFVKDLLYALARRVLGGNVVKYGKYIFDFSKPFSEMTMYEAIFHYHPNITLQDIDNIDKVVTVAKSFGISIDEKWGLGKIQTVIFEKVVERYLIQPTFITDYPTEVSPLARAHDNDSFFSDRFELFIAGHEIGNGFSELNDSEEQENRFCNQLQYSINDCEDSDNSANYDRDYLIALEHGLPPTSGVGIGIDRLVMLFTNQNSIRDVILFPSLRLKKK